MSSVLPHKGTKTRLPFGRDSSLKCVTSSGLALGSWKPISFFAHRWCQKLGSIRAPSNRDGHYAWFNPVLPRALAVNGEGFSWVCCRGIARSGAVGNAGHCSACDDELASYDFLLFRHWREGCREASHIRHANGPHRRAHREALKFLSHRPQSEEQVLRCDTWAANPSDEVLGNGNPSVSDGAQANRCVTRKDNSPCWQDVCR